MESGRGSRTKAIRGCQQLPPAPPRADPFPGGPERKAPWPGSPVRVISYLAEAERSHPRGRPEGSGVADRSGSDHPRAAGPVAQTKIDSSCPLEVGGYSGWVQSQSLSMSTGTGCVILPLQEYEQRIDLHDLAVVAERREEPAIEFSEFRKQ